MAQRLKVFQKPSELLEQFVLDPSNLDPALKKLFKELGIGERPIPIPSVRPKVKIVNLRDLLQPIRIDEDLEFLNDFQVPEAEKVLKKILKKIKIKND